MKITVKRLSGGRIQVAVIRPEHNRTLIKEYESEQEARAVLVDIGIPANALDFYFSLLLPRIELNQELTFPELEIPEIRSLVRGFRFAEAT